MVVCHTCDNRPCIRPSHLVAANQLDNIRDAWAKGRGRNPVLHGTSNPSSKLTLADVAEMKELRSAGLLLHEIGQMFGVSKSNVYNAVTGRSYK